MSNTEMSLQERLRVALKETAMSGITPVVPVLPDLTPYGAAQVASRQLGRKVTPNAMYGYAKRGTIPSYKDKAGKTWFRGADFNAWLKQAKTKKVQAKTDWAEFAKLYG